VNRYRYFGAAKKLPGVRELFRKRAPEREKRTRFEMMKGIDADYYGYRDDDDGVLEELERAAEEGSLQQAREDWEARKAARLAAGEPADEEESDGEGDGEEARRAERFQEALPDREAIERAILEKRKREMLAMLGGGDAGGAPKHKEEGSINLVPKSW